MFCQQWHDEKSMPDDRQNPYIVQNTYNDRRSVRLTDTWAAESAADGGGQGLPACRVVLSHWPPTCTPWCVPGPEACRCRWSVTWPSRAAGSPSSAPWPSPARPPTSRISASRTPESSCSTPPETRPRRFYGWPPSADSQVRSGAVLYRIGNTCLVKELLWPWLLNSAAIRFLQNNTSMLSCYSEKSLVRAIIDIIFR